MVLLTMNKNSRLKAAIWFPKNPLALNKAAFRAETYPKIQFFTTKRKSGSMQKSVGNVCFLYSIKHNSTG